MENRHFQILIIGAGTAGITVAARLKRKNKKLDIGIIDPAEKHYYQPAWTLVGAGTFDFSKTEKSTGDLIPKGVSWIQDYADHLDVDQQSVITRKSGTISYDYLVACPGIQMNADDMPGLRETLNKNNVCSNYVDPKYTWEVLQNFKGGNAVFTQPATPVKCGGAPQKIMYLAEEYFRKSGVRDKTNVIFATPGSVIFGTEPFKQTLMEIVDKKDIYLRFFHKMTKVDGPGKKVHYSITKFINEPEKRIYNPKEISLLEISSEEVVIPFDMIHLAPPQSAPDFIRNSKISWQDGPDKGWIQVDYFTLQHPVYKNVFALGDAVALPTAKTGAAIRKQAPVLVENLISQMNRLALPKRYEGYSSCPIVTGYGKMLLCEFNYKNERDSDPLLSKMFDTSKELYSMWLLKKYGLPFMYWHMMLKGRA